MISGNLATVKWAALLELHHSQEKHRHFFLPPFSVNSWREDFAPPWASSLFSELSPIRKDFITQENKCHSCLPLKNGGRV